MPTSRVGANIEFCYTDSGPPAQRDYATIFIIHGHSFHSGIFSRISSTAVHHDLRLICVNRREYPGSTPFTEEELRIIHEGSNKERSDFLLQQGILYCLLVDKLIEELSLPQNRGLMIAGWSMGNIFSLALLTAIGSLPAETQERLKTHVRKVLLWDPPGVAVGVANPPGSYFPLFDTSLTPEERGKTFGLWVSSYFKHGDLSSHDFSELNQRDPDPLRQATILGMTAEDISASTDFAPGPKCDTPMILPGFMDAIFKQTEKALFDPACREQWGGLDILHLYGDANSWIVVFTIGLLKKRMKANEIQFHQMEGANHFPMWDEPARTVLLLKEIAEK